MSKIGRHARTLSLVTAAFAGGALAAHASHASGRSQSPYDPLDQLARVLVLVENHYVDPVERNKLLEGAIEGLVAKLDPHSAYMPAPQFAQFNEDTEGRFAGIGVEVDIRDDVVTVIAPIDGSPAARAGIRSGDQIVAVDGRPIQGASVEKMIELMRGPAGTRVRLTIKRPGTPRPLSFELVREPVRVVSVEHKRLDRDVGYLRLKQFQQGTHEELLRAAAALRQAGPQPLAGVILDLRGNPGGLVDEAEAVADEFLAGGTIYSTRHRGQVIEEVSAHWGGALCQPRLVVLVSEYTASSAELVAGALQDNGRASVVGARTFGKGSVQTVFELQGQAGLRLTTMRYYTPKGRAIQVAGIQPDVVVEHRDQAEAGLAAWREGSLEGHLSGEPGGESGTKARVLRAGKSPGYTPIAELPADPARGSDFALSLAYQMLLGAARAAQGEGH
ncbi:MAG: S41 family peptidase [Deltaproteobacteria bacterium]|nr:S41 family peptidase [Deltaproteobacteria bacterium]